MMRSKIAILISLLFSVGLIYSLDFIFNYLGIDLYIEYDEPIYVPESRFEGGGEKPGTPTFMVLYIFILSAMLGWRLYHWIDSGKIHGYLERSTLLYWKYWLLGFTIYFPIVDIISSFDILSPILGIIMIAILIPLVLYLTTRYEHELKDDDN